MNMGDDTQLVPGSLDELAQRIRGEHGAAEGAAGQGVARATEAGRLLREAKSRVLHGGWLPWLRDHCDVSERTARAYMRLSRHAAELEATAPRMKANDLPKRTKGG